MSYDSDGGYDSPDENRLCYCPKCKSQVKARDFRNVPTSHGSVCSRCAEAIKIRSYPYGQLGFCQGCGTESHFIRCDICLRHLRWHAHERRMAMLAHFQAAEGENHRIRYVPDYSYRQSLYEIAPAVDNDNGAIIDLIGTSPWQDQLPFNDSLIEAHAPAELIDQFRGLRCWQVELAGRYLRKLFGQSLDRYLKSDYDRSPRPRKTYESGITLMPTYRIEERAYYLYYKPAGDKKVLDLLRLHLHEDWIHFVDRDLIEELAKCLPERLQSITCAQVYPFLESEQQALDEQTKETLEDWGCEDMRQRILTVVWLGMIEELF